MKLASSSMCRKADKYSLTPGTRGNVMEETIIRDVILFSVLMHVSRYYKNTYGTRLDIKHDTSLHT